jgi:hypothetical protein
MKPLLSMTSLLAALWMLSVTVPHAAAQATTTTSLTASPNPIISGKQVTFTVTVQTTGSSPLASFVDLSIIGNFTSGLSVVNGVATTVIPFNTVGTYTVVATYTHDPKIMRVHPQWSAWLYKLHWGCLSTTTTVATSVNPAQVGEYLITRQPYRATARALPQERSTFLRQRHKSRSGDAGEQRDRYGYHRLPNSGDYEMTANYSGDANNAGSISD